MLTCTTDGSKSYHCTADGCRATTGSVVIPAMGHNFAGWNVTKEATCTEEGLSEHECSICGVKETLPLPPTGHPWLNHYIVDKEATCLEDGEKSIHCKVCDAVKEDSRITIEALGHAYTESVVEPTCSQKGYTLYVCGRCGDSYTDNETAAKGHSFGEWITDTDSTCTSEGIQHRECSECGYIETKGINKKEHPFSNEYTVDKEAKRNDRGKYIIFR